MRELLLTLTLLGSSAVMAQDGDGEGDVAVELSVKPLLCVTDRQNRSCEMSFEIAWRSRNAGDFCVYSDFVSTPIGCWLQQTSGLATEVRVVDTPFSYWISASSSEQRLAVAVIDVVSTYVEDRRRNRRKRHAWSVL